MTIQYEERKKLGICVSCFRDSFKGGVYCKRHAEENSLKASARYQKLENLGLCVKCERPKARRILSDKEFISMCEEVISFSSKASL